MSGKGVWYVWGENMGCFVLGFKHFRALCLYVRGGGGGSGAMCEMGQCCCQCYKLTISAKSLKRWHGGGLMRQGTEVEGCAACRAGTLSRAHLYGKGREVCSRYGGVAVLGLPGD